jgi:hypothetical protein
MNQNTPEDRKLRPVRWLIWLYFWLLLVEGALRKWLLPDLSNPLLIVRDPVVILIYLFAIRARIFPWNWWFFSLAIMGSLSFALTFVTLWLYLPPNWIALIAGYGFHANFLHLPLIFVIAYALRAQDVRKFGWWTLALLVPMTALMVGQFHAAPDAWLNRTAGGEGEMMMAALGKVRTAGPFSFVIGVVAYYALATAFLVWAMLRKGVYKNWLLMAAGVALAIGIAVSGSRSVVAACAGVIGSLVIVLFLRPDVIGRFGRILIVTFVLGLIVSRTAIFKEGVDVLAARFNEVAEATEQSITGGLVSRVFSSFGESFYVLTKAPFLGYGLGIGTNAGGRFLTGHSMFLLTEGEWSRVFLENGPVLGLAYVIWRLTLTIRVGILCLKSVRLGNLLPLLIFSSCFFSLLNGQFGQPTILGFAVFATGLALAARNEEFLPIAAPVDAAGAKPALQTVRTRSVYADRLHGSPASHDHTNGSVDR